MVVRGSRIATEVYNPGQNLTSQSCWSKLVRNVPILCARCWNAATDSYAGGTMNRGGGAVLGAILGGLVGFLLRPSVPFLGQLPFSTVITRGSNLTGLDVILKSTAEQSFNYLVIGAVVGAVVLAIAAGMMGKSKASPSQ